MAEKVDYAALKKGGFMRQKQKGCFSLRLAVVGHPDRELRFHLLRWRTSML